MYFRISESLSLPVDVMTQVIAILAKRRAGKSYTMRRLVERLLKMQQQVVIVDPKGDQWGIRSSADGKKPGYPVLILGGEHGDLPLEVGGGELVARLVVEERVSVLLDLSQFRKHELATFMTAFLENLYRLKAQEKYRTPIMLVIDESDAVAPQKPQKGEERMLGAIEDIVRRGGQRGIGCTLVTQRSAVLNKNVLTQAQMLIVLRTIAPQDIAAMKAWIDVHGTVEQGKELIESLPSLPVGDAWFWSPGWPTEAGIFVRAHVSPIETFDSGATPKPGQRQIIPKNLADVDLDALKGQMAATIEQVKANDPKALKAEIARLTRELEAKKPVPAALPSQENIERAVAIALKRRDSEWEKVVAAWRGYAGKLYMLIEAAWKGADTPLKPADRPADVPVPGTQYRIAGAELKEGQLVKEIAPGIVAPATATQVMVQETNDRDGAPLKAGARRMLEVMVARHPMKMTKPQFATLSGMSVKSSTFEQYISALRRAGLIEVRDGIYTASELGIAAVGSVKPTPQTPSEVLDMWLGNLKAGAGKILVAIIRNNAPIIPEELAQEVEMSMTSSTFEQYISILKRNGLIEKTSEGLVASRMFYPD